MLFPQRAQAVGRPGLYKGLLGLLGLLLAGTVAYVLFTYGSVLREAARIELGMRAFLKAVDLPPVPQMIRAPRANPYYFWDPEEVRQNGQ